MPTDVTRPYVLLNVAMTTDGKIDTIERRGAAISSDHDRARVDRLRASVDAVMVGGHTLHAEDPRLTVKSAALCAERVARGAPRQPAKIGVATHFGLSASSRFVTDGGGRVIVFVPRIGRPEPVEGVELYAVGERRVDLLAAVATLEQLGIRRVLVEGGGTLNFELLRLGLVDEVHVYLAPLIFGGATAPTLADGAGLTRDVAVRLTAPSIDVEDDGGVVLRYMVKRS